MANRNTLCNITPLFKEQVYVIRSDSPNYDTSWIIPDTEYYVFAKRTTRYCVVIPIINENGNIISQLGRMRDLGIPEIADIIIADGGSSDGSTDHEKLISSGIRALLVMKSAGGQSAQLRGGYAFCLAEGYEGIITVDGNNKDSIESIPLFITALDNGADYAQGSRFITGGAGINTPLFRTLAIRLIHAPLVSLSARHWFTDTTNGFRAYSRRYLLHLDVQPFRDIFHTYELNFYLSARATRLGLSVTEIPVLRRYPKGPAPTKISLIKGNLLFLKNTLLLVFGCFNPVVDR